MRRQYIFDTIRGVFRTYGFAPLETPSMENLSTPAGQIRRRGRQAPLQDTQLGRLRRRPIRRRGAAGVENLREGAPLRPHGAVRAMSYSAPGRTDVPLQSALPDPARMARRPAAERPLPRILPVRRRRDRHPLAAVRGRTGRDRRARVPGAGHPRGAEDEQPQNPVRHRRGDRPCRHDDGHHHRHRQARKDRAGQREGRAAGARIEPGGGRQTATDTRTERRQCAKTHEIA